MMGLHNMYVQFEACSMFPFRIAFRQDKSEVFCRNERNMQTEAKKKKKKI